MVEITDVLEVEKYIDNVDAVIFDLDDTLYSEKDYVRSGFKKISELFNAPEMENELWNAFINRKNPIDFTLEKYGLSDKKDIAIQEYRYQRPIISLYSGVKEMIERIKITKKVGIITDGRPEGQHNKINALGLDKLIYDIIVTDELGGVQFRKPCDIAFRIMQCRWKIPFEKILYVGDNAEKDFQAPNQLGMRSLYYINDDGLYNNRGMVDSEKINTMSEIDSRRIK